MAVAEIGGVERTISLVLTPEAKVGDYAIVHAGFALSILDEVEARETLRLFAEMEALAQEAERSAAGQAEGEETR